MDVNTSVIPRGVEVDVVTDWGSWSLRVAELAGGQLSLIVLDHLTGDIPVAELLHHDTGPPSTRATDRLREGARRLRATTRSR